MFQSGKSQDVAVKTCKLVENEDTRKLESRADKFLLEACEWMPRVKVVVQNGSNLNALL